MMFFSRENKALKEKHKALESRFNALHDAHMNLMQKYTGLHHEWDNLVARINAKGGERFLKHGVIYAGRAPAQLTKDDIKRLLSLVHPDKHNGKQSAVEMTQKLLSMR